MPTGESTVSNAVQHHQAGRLTEAERIYRDIVSAEPKNVAAWHLLGTVELQLGNAVAAAECFRNAVALNPSFAEAHNNLGLALCASGSISEAEIGFRRALELRPSYPEASFNLGNALLASGKNSEALASYKKALAVKPDYAAALCNMGTAHRGLGDLENAVGCFRAALEIDPCNSQAHNNLGSGLFELGELHDAALSFERAIAIRPSYASPHAALAHLHLLRGDFERGWQEWEWRWKTGQLVEPAFDQPRWVGAPLAGKTILLHAEQGLGDTIQFVRYAQILKHRGATVILECQESLLGLLAAYKGIDKLVRRGGQVPAFDVHAPLLSVPGILQTTLNTIPAQVPYLQADRRLVAEWEKKLSRVEGLRIGINWQGRQEIAFAKRRDIPAEMFERLAEVEGVRLVSLQKEAEESNVESRRSNVEKGPAIVDLGEIDAEQGAFMDTAAIMRNLDLVITSDTSVAHLAGALAVPVWVALPFVPDWRWLLDRSDSPWYPTMRLFRQKKLGEWDGVFEEIEGALRDKVKDEGGRMKDE